MEGEAEAKTMDDSIVDNIAALCGVGMYDVPKRVYYTKPGSPTDQTGTKPRTSATVKTRDPKPSPRDTKLSPISGVICS